MRRLGLITKEQFIFEFSILSEKIGKFPKIGFSSITEIVGFAFLNQLL